MVSPALHVCHLMNESRVWGAYADLRSALWTNVSPASSHTQGLCYYTVPPSLNRRRLAGPHLSAYAHPQSTVVTGRCWLAHWSAILWRLCADSTIYWPHKSAGFIKGRGDYEQQINEIKRRRRRERGLCKFQPLTLWGSHWNWSCEP